MSIFQMSLIASALILLIVVIRALALYRLPKNAFLALWGITALRLLLPFSVPLPAGIQTVCDLSTAFTVPTRSYEKVFVSQEAMHFPGWAILWLLGFLFLAIYFSLIYLRWVRKFRMSIPDQSPYVQKWLADHRLFRQVEVRSLDTITSPLTYGILRPVILLPKKLDRTDVSVLRYVLTHEYIHIRRFDGVLKILFTLVLCVHWFNPLVWVMYVLANRDLELSCDACVLKAMGRQERSSYACSLIDLEEIRQGFAPFYSSFSKNALEERIEAIMKFKKVSTFAWLLALVVVLGATTAFAIGSASNEVDSNVPEGCAVELTNEPNNQDSGPNEVDSSPCELVSVNKDDESKFTAEEWEKILSKVKSGDILFFDTREEEIAYFSQN